MELYLENSYNTLYLYILFISLFFNKTSIYTIFLENEPKFIEFIYLQEMIKQNIFDLIEKNICISKNIINEIRNYLYLIEVLSNKTILLSSLELSPIMPSKLFSQNYNILCNQQIEELYDYLNNNITNNKIEFNNNFVSTYLEIYPHNILDKQTTEIKISNLIKIWIKKLNVKLQNIPIILPILIKRDNSDREENTVFITNASKGTVISIDINLKLRIEEMNNICWNIHSIICFGSHYYSIMYKNNKWYSYNIDNNSTIKLINIKDYATQIKKECFFIIYKYDD
jgi:hypothetical protein